jgi:predicted kinase
MNDIAIMAKIYNTKPILIWINTPPKVANSRIGSDTVRASRTLEISPQSEFDIIFETTDNLPADSLRFIALIKTLIR